MLASLLPGLRDLRAPLAAGYLWLAAGWLYFAPRLPASVNDADGVLKDIYRVVDTSSPLAVGAGVTFVAYMLGILSTGLLKREAIREIVMFPPQIYILALRSLVESRLGEEIRKRQPSFLDELDERLIYYGDFFSQATIRRTEGLVVRKLTDRAMTDSDYRSELVRKSDPKGEGYIQGLRRTMPAYTGDPSDPYSQSVLEGTLPDQKEFEEEILGQIKELGFQVFIAIAVQNDVRSLIEALVWSAGDVPRRVSEVVDELKVVPARIIVDNAATYERWDRLNGEAEFREAVVPPLLAIIIALAARGAFPWVLAILLTAVPLAILFQGAAKENEAQIQLIEAIEADAIRVTALERRAVPDWHSLDGSRTADRESTNPEATPSGVRDRLRAATARLGGRWRRTQ